MKILSWNCRGLGNPRTIQDLCHLVEEKMPNVVILTKTKLRKANGEKIRWRLKFEGCLVIEPIGQKG